MDDAIHWIAFNLVGKGLTNSRTANWSRDFLRFEIIHVHVFAHDCMHIIIWYGDRIVKNDIICIISNMHFETGVHTLLRLPIEYVAVP